MTNARQNVRIGILVTVTAALVVLVIVVWGGLHLFRHRDRYAVEIPGSVNGLLEGADVLYEGIRVGAVREIAIAPDDIRRVRVAIEVDRDTPVRTDTKATLAMTGITGAKVLELHAGTPEAPPLAPGGTIALGETTIDRVEHELDDVTEKSRRLLERADHIEQASEAVLANLQKLTDPARLDALIAESRDALGELAATGNAVRGIIAENRAPLAAAVADLRQASRSFKDLAREVREQPSRLLMSSARPDRRLP